MNTTDTQSPAKHTPTKWKAIEANCEFHKCDSVIKTHASIIEENGDKVIARLHSIKDARDIVRAVNSFDPMKEALEETLHQAEQRGECMFPDKIPAWVKMVKAALKLAKEGE